MPENPLAIIDWLVSQPAPADAAQPPTIKAWKSRHDKELAPWIDTPDRAVAGGFLADRVAYAFANGYHSALLRLVPSLAPDAFPALCITEEGGGHPRMIKSRLAPIDPDGADPAKWRLNGRKQFITGAAEADVYFVAASTGTDESRQNNIRLVRINSDEAGVSVELMPDLPFIPEVSHGVLWMKDIPVQASQMLPGDGYLRYIKPFRTIEDLHVSSAVLGYFFRIATQFDWPRPQKQEILSLIVAMRTLAMGDPLDTGVHIALGGALQMMDRLTAGLDLLWEKVDAPVREAWERDRTLLGIAKKVRTARLASAWDHYKAG